MDRASKLLIAAWAVVAMVAESYYVSGAWPRTFVLGPALFAIAWAAATWERRAVAPVLLVAYLVPIGAFLGSGRYNAIYSVIWLAPLLGAALSGGAWREWHLPRRWRLPLVTWVGGVCLTAPVIALRAVDFKPDLLFRGRAPLEALGGAPMLTLTWVMHVALVLAVGLLWFDWLCATDRTFVRRWVIRPLAAGSLVLAAVCVYQLVFDITFLNYSVYASLGRASGTMLDGNVAGLLAACWIGGWCAILLGDATSRARLTACAAVGVLLWLAVWSTGSRTAFASAAIVSLIALLAIGRRGLLRRRVLAAAAIGGLLLVAVAVFATGRQGGAIGPIERLSRMLPSASADGVREMAAELWNRNQYGVAATRAIVAYPAFGIGVGSFNEMAGEFIPGGITPDNAQNWYRHQIAELGVVGSLGWMVFLASFGWWLFSPGSNHPLASALLRGVLVAVAVISLVGMPGQDPFVAITLWTMAAWIVLESGPPPAGRPSRTAAFAATAVLVVFVAGTALQATGRLRVPVRLQRLGGEYRYGLSFAEPDPEGGEFRWAARRSTAIVPAATRVLELTLRVNHIDPKLYPVHVKGWVDRKPVIDATLTPMTPFVTRTVVLPDGEQRALVETWADRAIQAPPPDGREMAVMVRWRFLTRLP